MERSYRAPRNLGLFEKIQKVFPNFRWEVVEKTVPRRNGGDPRKVRFVVFEGYPTRMGFCIPLSELERHCDRVLVGHPSSMTFDTKEAIEAREQEKASRDAENRLARISRQKGKTWRGHSSFVY